MRLMLQTTNRLASKFHSRLEQTFQFRQIVSLKLEKKACYDTDQENREKQVELDELTNTNPFLEHRSALKSRLEAKSTVTNEKISTSKNLSFEQKPVSFYLKAHPNLRHAQMSPYYLTILDEKRASSISETILKHSLTNESSSCSPVFVDMQPGVCLISKHLASKLTMEPWNRFAKSSHLFLIESRKQYIENSNRLKSMFDSSLKISVSINMKSPFEFASAYKCKELINFYSRSAKTSNYGVNERRKLIVYGILPWNRLGFFQQLYKDFSLDLNYFSLSFETDAPTEFYIYIPELVMAKLQPNASRIYQPFRSSLGIYTPQFLSKFEVVAEDSIENFFPYPLNKMPHLLSAYPFNRLDLKKMYLVRMVFDPSFRQFEGCDTGIVDSLRLNLVHDKSLFYQFVDELFKKRKLSINKALKTIYNMNKTLTLNADRTSTSQKISDRDHIASLCKDLGINAYSSIVNLREHHFLSLFNALRNNDRSKAYFNDLNEKELTSKLFKMSSSHHKKFTSLGQNRKTEMKALKLFNKSLTGQLKIPGNDNN